MSVPGRRPRRNIVLTLLPDEWDRLVAQSRSAERDPFQQARWLILRGLGDRAPDGATLDEATTADVA